MKCNILVGLGIYVLISISSLLLPSEAAFADDSLELRESAVNKYLNACNAVEFIKQIEERQPSKLKFFSTDQDEKIFKKVIDSVYRKEIIKNFTADEINGFIDTCKFAGLVVSEKFLKKHGELLEKEMDYADKIRSKKEIMAYTNDAEIPPGLLAKVSLDPGLEKFFQDSSQSESPAEILRARSIFPAAMAKAILKTFRYFLSGEDYEFFTRSYPTADTENKIRRVFDSEDFSKRLLYALNKAKAYSVRQSFREAAESFDISSIKVPDSSLGDIQPARVPNGLNLSEACTPSYPAEALEEGEEGSVVLQLLISSTGWVERAKVEVSSGSDRLDQAAAECLRDVARFVPSYIKGEPRESWQRIKWTWKLQN